MKRPEEEGRRWLAQAEDDLEFVRWVRREGRFFDKGCFLAQQAAEKALKGCLYRSGERAVLGHSLLELLGRLIPRAPSLAALRDSAKKLDRFYIPTRYPNGLPGGSPFESFLKEDLDQALRMAGEIVSAARTMFGPP